MLLLALAGPGGSAAISAGLSAAFHLDACVNHTRLLAPAPAAQELSAAPAAAHGSGRGFARPPASGAQLFVSVSGSDSSGTGTLQAPFASLGRARDEIRKTAVADRPSTTVFIRGGTYYLPQPLRLEARSAGTPQRVLVCVARALNATAAARVTLSLRRGRRTFKREAKEEKGRLKSDLITTAAGQRLRRECRCAGDLHKL